MTPDATVTPDVPVTPEVTAVPGTEATEAPGAEATAVPETEATTVPETEATTAPETEPTQAPETTTPDSQGGELEEVQPGDIAAEEAGGQLSAVMNNIFGKVSAAEIEAPSAAAEVVSFETTLEEGTEVSPVAGESTEVDAGSAAEAPGTIENTGASDTIENYRSTCSHRGNRIFRNARHYRWHRNHRNTGFYRDP